LNSITPELSGQSPVLVNDQQFVWHSYSSLTAPIPAYEVVYAEGVNLHLADGTQLIDGMA